MSVRPSCSDLTDVTLADEGTNSIQSNGVNRAILGNVAMQVEPPVKWRYLVGKFANNALMQLVSLSGRICNQCK